MSVGAAIEQSGELAAVLDSLWGLLHAAVGDFTAPLRTPVVVGLNAAAPDGRVMVLRGADRDSAQLIFHTDVRSPKVVALAADARVAIIGYDAARLIQLRLHGRTRLETRGPAAEAAWRAMKTKERRNFSTVLPPGAILDAAGDGQPGVPDEAVARCHFARLIVEVGDIDWISLAPSGHRRARFVASKLGWTGNWRVP